LRTGITVAVAGRTIASVGAATFMGASLIRGPTETLGRRAAP